VSLAYRALYGAGITPWEQMAKLPVGDQIAALFAREEEEREPPYGPALDLGCGSGIWAVKLAARGWDVTAVDVVPKALRRARSRARDAGVEVRLLQGDVTALGDAGAGSGYRLLVDFGCFHDALSDSQRRQEGREAGAVAAPGATLLMTAFKPGRRGPLPRGASRDDIVTAFPGWTLVDEQAMEVAGGPAWVRRAAPRFYRLRRDATG
jgi:SAM-dependent methyltransferase